MKWTRGRSSRTALTLTIWFAFSGAATYVAVTAAYGAPSGSPIFALLIASAMPLLYLLSAWAGAIAEVHQVKRDVRHRQRSLLTRACEILVASAALLLGAPALVVLWICAKTGRVVRLSTERYWTLSATPLEITSFRLNSAHAKKRRRGFVIVGLFARLPEFFHVVRGDLALCGPRPIEPQFAAVYRDVYPARFRVLPGVISPWDVARYEFHPVKRCFILRTGFERMLEIESEWLLRAETGRQLDLLVKTIVLGALILWQGIESRDVDASIDLGPTVTINEVLDSASHGFLMPLYALAFIVVAGALELGATVLVTRSLPYPELLPVVWTRGAPSNVLVYYGVSLMVGIALAVVARVIEFNFAYGEIATAERARLVLAAAAIAIGAISLEDNLIHRSVLGFGVIVVAFTVAYGWRWLQGLRQVNGGLYLIDMNALMALRQVVDPWSWKGIAHWCLVKGWTFCALVVVKLAKAERSHDAVAIKLATVALLRLRLYHSALRAAKQINKDCEAPRSQMLMCFQSAAEVHAGLGEQAAQRLIDAGALFPDNAYVHYHLAYVHWQRGETDAAATSCERAVYGLGGERHIDATPALALAAHISCDRILIEYRVERSRGVDRVREAQRLASLAAAHGEVIEQRTGLPIGVYLRYLCGYSMLLSRQYTDALAMFNDAVWRSSHLGARFRIAVLRMIGTTNYETAIRELEWIRNSLRVGAALRRVIDDDGPGDFRTNFYRLVTRNLERAREVALRREMFTDEIVFYQADFKENVPSEAIAWTEEQRNRSRELRASLFKAFAISPPRLTRRPGLDAAKSNRGSDGDAARA